MGSKTGSSKSLYICSSCGYESLRWTGKCPNCGEWNTLEETMAVQKPSAKSASGNITPADVHNISSKSGGSKRISVGIEEVDRVLGGDTSVPASIRSSNKGLVKGEVVLLSGEPGIGKSTLLLQICANLAKNGVVLYVSGEESRAQLSSRFRRVCGKSRLKISNFKITECVELDRILALIEELKPSIVAVDSIQSVHTSAVRSFSGSVSQVKVCGMQLTQCAKSLQIPMFIVGQVTKEGIVAGPKVLEHVVDVVLYFEGDEFGLYRILRGVKNRFGTTDEVGIFEMTSEGVKQVSDPSSVFRSDNQEAQSGVAVSAVFKGSRVLLVEVQALTSRSAFGAPRRVPTGLSKSRVEMLCAVLTRRAGINLSDDDVFVNVMGGMKLDDPAIDLAVCMAIVSSKRDKPVGNSVFVGEVGLSGDVRPVPFQDRITSDMKRRKLAIISSSSGKNISSLVKLVLGK
ncbi:MAG: DNA repair protein RadA [Patescibacteria group bacterium]|nr:DNA repair protein RadA [Patescibacteria group bacterium]